MTTDPTTVAGTIKPTHRHVKRGTEYQHIGTARIQSDVPLQDMDRVEVYLGSGDDDLWARRQVEFHDGRFAAITPTPTDAEPVARITDAMVDAAFKALPSDVPCTMGTGEMYRILEAAFGHRYSTDATWTERMAHLDDATDVSAGASGASNRFGLALLMIANGAKDPDQIAVQALAAHPAPVPVPTSETAELVAEYRPTMDKEVLHSWARDARDTMKAQAAEIARLRSLVSASEAERYRSCGELLTRAEKAEARGDEWKGVAERLASALEYIDDYALSYPDLGLLSAVSRDPLAAHEDLKQKERE